MNLGMISNYVKAKWSKGISEKKVDVTTKDIRLLACFGNGDDIAVCPGLRPSERKMGKFFCGECGCGDKATTWLNGTEKEYTKLDHPYLSCPRKMPGFSDYEPANKKDDTQERKVKIELTLGGEILRIKNLVKPEMTNAEKEKQKTQSKEEQGNQQSENAKAGCPSCEMKARVRDELIDKLRREENLEPDFKDPNYTTRFQQLFKNDPRVIQANKEIVDKKTNEGAGCSSCALKKKLRDEITKQFENSGLEGEELKNKINEEFTSRLREAQRKESS